MKKVALVTGIFSLLFTTFVFAGSGHDHKSEKHCEKKIDGKTVHLDKVKTRKQCKQEGGRWVKHKKDDGHDHGSHNHKDDGHDHKDDGHNHKH